MFGQEAYHVGEFVYTNADPSLANTANNAAKKIFLIEKIYRGPGGAQMMSGSRFFRPPETFHVPSR